MKINNNSKNRSKNNNKSKNKSKSRNTGLYILLAAALLSVAAMLAALSWSGRQTVGEFTPPPFDEAAQTGTPEVPENLGYGELYQEGMAYRFSVCGNVTAEDGKAVVYLTNSEENDVWLKVRIYDEKEETLGESGLIKPGEYVRAVQLQRDVASGEKITMKIMGYVPESYQSAGSVRMNTYIG